MPCLSTCPSIYECSIVKIWQSTKRGMREEGEAGHIPLSLVFFEGALVCLFRSSSSPFRSIGVCSQSHLSCPVLSHLHPHPHPYSPSLIHHPSLATFWSIQAHPREGTLLVTPFSVHASLTSAKNMSQESDTMYEIHPNVASMRTKLVL